MSVRQTVFWGFGIVAAAACSDADHRLGGDYSGAGESGAASENESGGSSSGGSSTGGRPNIDLPTGGTAPSPSDGGIGNELGGASDGGEKSTGSRPLMLGGSTTHLGVRSLMASDAEGIFMAWETPTSIEAAVGSERPVFAQFLQPAAVSDEPDLLRLVGVGRAKPESVHVLYLDKTGADQSGRIKLMARHHEGEQSATPTFQPAVELSELGVGDSTWPGAVFALAKEDVGYAAWFDASDGECRLMSTRYEWGQGWLPVETIANVGETCGTQLTISLNEKARAILAWVMPATAAEPGLYSAVRGASVTWGEPELVDPNPENLHLVPGDRGILWAWRQEDEAISTRKYSLNLGWSEATEIASSAGAREFVLASDGTDGAVAFWLDEDCQSQWAHFFGDDGWARREEYVSGQAVLAFDANEEGTSFLVGYTVGSDCEPGPLFAKIPSEQGYVSLDIGSSWTGATILVDDEGTPHYGCGYQEGDEARIKFGWIE
jgi:hypothetical protein